MIVTLQGLAPELALQLPDALLHLADGAIAPAVVVFGHGSCLQQQAKPTIQQVERHAIAPRDDGNAVSPLQGLFDDPRPNWPTSGGAGHDR